MKRIQAANVIAMIFGLISIAFGVYKLTIGSDFLDYIFSFFLGITLLGTAYLNHKEWGKKEDE